MIQTLSVEKANDRELILHAMICCQNPSLNPAQLVAAVNKYLPDLAPDFSCICRREIYKNTEELFR